MTRPKKKPSSRVAPDSTRTTPAPPAPPAGGARRPFRRIAIAVALLIAAVLAWASVRRVGPAERAYRVGRGGGAVTRLAPGLRVVVPGIARLVVVPPDPLQQQGEVALRTPEGAEVKVSWGIVAAIPDAALAALVADTGGGADPGAALRGAAREAIERWGGTASVESIALGEGRAGVENAIRTRLTTLGFETRSVSLRWSSGTAEERAALAARALAARTVATGVKVAIIGLDGADWEVIEPLIARGRLPTLARLRARAAWGPMKSMDPMLSPILWTTVATGKPPDQHGIIDFLVRDARTGKPEPVSSRARRVKALWNITTDAGRSADVIAWWATWPAEEIQGHLVSDRVAYSTFSFTGDLPDQTGATWPADDFQKLRPLLVDAAKIRDAELRRFADATPEEFRRLATIVASERSYQAAALDLLKRGQPDLFALYYQGIDEVSHRFAHFMPPKMAMVTQADYARYHGTVEAYYEYQDALLGEILPKLDPQTEILVLSDHGFRNGGGRPPDDPPYIEGKPGLWHRRYGIFMMTGPVTVPGRLDTTSLLDVAPTVLYLLGLPRAEDMPGRVVQEGIDPGFRARVPGRSIATYEGIGRTTRPAQDLVADSRVDDEMIAKLRSLGYVGGEVATGSDGGAGGPSSGAASSGTGSSGPASSSAPSGGGEALVTAHVNEAMLELKNKNYPRAEAAVAAALQMSPTLVPALILKAQIAREQKQYDLAIDTARKILDLDPEGERQSYSQIALVYLDAGRTQEGIAFLRDMARDHPKVGEIPAALGMLLLKTGDKTGAEAELLKSLHLDPSLGEPLTELYTLYKDTDKISTLEPIVRQGLAINDQSVVHHNWMGLIYQWNKNLGKAEQEFKRAMEIDPDYAATMANLGALYGRSGRLPEAVEILKRAVGKDDNNLEAWINLGAAEGRMNHPKEAITALETARRKGARSTTLYNALALAYLQDHQKERALGYLKESLVIDPSQKDAKELLEMMSRSS
ncbi:MAG TPA: alkaline phosphatase family protein [Patescibacteria group bacterium]|nr:alkaline phosphatase family protein [Patescibacteria group bacterium]